MPRYFIEVAYDGAPFGGFQIQKNAVTIQSELTQALEIFFKKKFELTGSSRTDAGVHARQNFFHFDMAEPIPQPEKSVYNLNAILPDEIAVMNFFKVNDDAHCRFDAVAREYKYQVYSYKNPFLRNTAYFFPYRIDIQKMNEAAQVLFEYTDFTSFSKKNTQVKNFNCRFQKSEWLYEGDVLIYRVAANRFLRGMVKALVGTMLRVGTGKLSVDDFKKVIESRDCSRADFSVPSKGLVLMEVKF